MWGKRYGPAFAQQGEDIREKHQPYAYGQDGRLLLQQLIMPIAKNGLTDKEVCKIHFRLFRPLILGYFVLLHQN